MKKIQELNYNDFCQVCRHNSELMTIAFDNALDNAYFWIEEYMNNAPRHISWLVGDRGEHIRFDGYYGNNAEVIEWLRDLQRTYCFLPDSYNEIIDKFDRYNDVYINGIYGYINLRQKDEDKLELLIDEIKEQLQDAILDRLNDEIDAAYKDENEIELLYEDANGLCDDFAVTDDLQTLININDLV